MDAHIDLRSQSSCALRSRPAAIRHMRVTQAASETYGEGCTVRMDGPWIASVHCGAAFSRSNGLYGQTSSTSLQEALDTIADTAWQAFLLTYYHASAAIPIANHSDFFNTHACSRQPSKQGMRFRIEVGHWEGTYGVI